MSQDSQEAEFSMHLFGVNFWAISSHNFSKYDSNDLIHSKNMSYMRKFVEAFLGRYFSFFSDIEYLCVGDGERVGTK